MQVWTVHARADGRDPVVLVAEGFAWGACLLGPLWLLARRLWLGALGWVAVVALLAVLPGEAALPLMLGLCLLTGAHGRDLLRRKLARRGYQEIGVVAAPGEDAALARLLAERPDLAAPMAQAALA
jgi:hypothetical protein